MLILRYPRGRARRAAGALATLATAVAGAAAVTGCTQSQSGPQSTQSASYQVTQPITQLVIRDAAGDVKVTAGTTNAVHVTERQSYRGSPPDSSHAVSNGTLTLTYTCPSGNCGIDYTVTVPTGLAVQVDAAAGNVSLAGLKGYAQVQASAGNVDLADLSGALQVQADAGDVQASGLDAPRAKLVATAGNVMLGFSAAPMNVSVQASAGNVKITLPGTADYAVTASADAGNKSITVPTSAGSAHVVQASSDAGNVSVLAG